MEFLGGSFFLTNPHISFASCKKLYPTATHVGTFAFLSEAS